MGEDTYQSIVDKNAIKDMIEEAIAESLGPDWTPSDAAYCVMQWLEDEGLMIVQKPLRGTECPNAPNGRCQVDTSMETGPSNCFHCERPM